jgi:hypothetical protein
VSTRLRSVVLFSLAAALAAIVFGALPPLEVARIYLLVLVALAGTVVASRTLARFGRLERSPRRANIDTEDPEPPPFFERAKRRIELANTSGVYFEQLRPRLREIAEQRLVVHGLRLSDEEARHLLGGKTYRALERRPEGDKFAPPPEGELARVVGALERI